LKPEKIIDFDLYFADGNPSQLVGLNEDFISSPRLDNLFSSYHGTTLPIFSFNIFNFSRKYWRLHQYCGAI
jgi:aspartyl aminopeptidase